MPCLLLSQLQNLCEKRRVADIENFEYYNRPVALNISLSGSQT